MALLDYNILYIKYLQNFYGIKYQKKKLIEFAKKFIGVPYKYGAKMNDAPNFFDCSGFIKYIFSEIGYGIPRSTIEQADVRGNKNRQP